MMTDDLCGEDNGAPAPVDWKARYDEACQCGALMLNTERQRAERAEEELRRVRSALAEVLTLVEDLEGARDMQMALHGTSSEAETLGDLEATADRLIACSRIHHAEAAEATAAAWADGNGRGNDPAPAGPAGGGVAPPLQTARQDGDGDGDGDLTPPTPLSFRRRRRGFWRGGL